MAFQIWERPIFVPDFMCKMHVTDIFPAFYICKMILLVNITKIRLSRINKRPKGPHIVHLSTMCHLFDRSARAAIFVYSSAWKHKLGRRHWDLASCQVSLNSVQLFQRRSRKWLSQSDPSTTILFFPSARKTQTWYRTLISCFLSSLVELSSVVSAEKSKMSRPIRGQEGHLVFPIGPKNTNLVEEIEILLPVKFRWIQFSSFREVENVSANQRPGRPSSFSDRPEKHKLGRGHWYLASCQVSLNSVQRFQRRRRKYFSQS